MIRFFLVCLLGMLLVCASACRQHQSDSQYAVVETYVGTSFSVVFDIAPLPSVNGSTLWLAIYTSQGKVAKFRIEIGSVTSVGPGPRIKSGTGTISAEPGSDGSVLLADLKKALEAKNLPKRIQRSSGLPFTYAIFRENQSRTSDGGFNDNPIGNWTAMKIFIPSGNDVGEVYLNFNPVIRKAEFSEKDSGYGDMVLNKLATVL